MSLATTALTLIRGAASPRTARGHHRSAVRRRRSARLAVEGLEGRALLTAGALDTTFGGTGVVTTAIGSGSGSDAAAVQTDSKVVVAGSSANSQGIWHTTVVRYNADGSLDSSFGSGGIAVLPLSTNTTKGAIYGDHGCAVAIQPDGKILVAGCDVSSPFTSRKRKPSAEFSNHERSEIETSIEAVAC